MTEALGGISRDSARTRIKVRRRREGETPLLAPEEEEEVPEVIYG
jgi:hypothetical protein